MDSIYHVKSIAEAHEIFGIPKPRHPLVSVIHHKDVRLSAENRARRFASDMYYIANKVNVAGSLKYGRSSYDFQEGSLLFAKPGQVLMNDGHSSSPEEGWTLLFHPDLIRKSDLAHSIENYSFFSYDTSEALHLSEEEKQSLDEIIGKIEKEFLQNIDGHSQTLIITNIELLLNYCTRYYDRQFYTRENLNKDILVKFEELLRSYYSHEKQLEKGIPTVQFCGEKLNLSPKYLSDLLKKATGENAKAHIDGFLIDKAKTLLLGSSESISGIAYSLGFEYSQHFAKVFKAKTGMTPSDYRSMN